MRFLGPPGEVGTSLELDLGELGDVTLFIFGLKSGRALTDVAKPRGDKALALIWSDSNGLEEESDLPDCISAARARAWIPMPSLADRLIWNLGFDATCGGLALWKAID